jgi:hypothetical protein
MTTLRIDVELDNAAFEDDFAGELRSVLAKIADRVAAEDLNDHRVGAGQGAVMDTNGNTVGRYRLEVG